MNKYADQQLACHAKGDVASNWIALRYAYGNLSQDESERWKHKNLFTLVLLPKFERGETEEDATEIPEVSSRCAVVD